MTGQNPYFKLYQVFSNFIANNIIDINSVRANRANIKQRRWVFPYFPENNDENFPRLSITFGRGSFTNTGADNFLSDDVQNGITIKTTQGQILTLPVTLSLFIKKDQDWQVPFHDGTIHNVRNTMQADYLAGLIQEKLETSYDYFASNGITLQSGVQVIQTFEEEQFWFVSEVEVTVSIIASSDLIYNPEDIIRIINTEYAVI